MLEHVTLDPDLVRTIAPGQVQDIWGLNAMQRLEPVGHGPGIPNDPFWLTAHARAARVHSPS